MLLRQIVLEAVQGGAPALLILDRVPALPSRMLQRAAFDGAALALVSAGDAVTLRAALDLVRGLLCILCLACMRRL